MAQRPTLPLEIQAAIEKARERVLSERFAYPLLFSPMGLLAVVAMSPIIRAEPKPATLKLELQRYSSALFDAEAQFYGTYAQDEPELRSWLDALALHVTNEVSREISSPLHDFHCKPSGRTDAIIKGLQQRIEHWIESCRHESTVMKLRAGYEALARSAKALSEHASAEHYAETRLLESAPAATLPPPQSPAGLSAVTDAIRYQEQHEEARATEAKRLRDSYFAAFSEKIIVLDVCWAAKQHYREWNRWIGGQLKVGSKPDMAFRAILQSGKRPEEYRTETRPKGWK